MEVDQGQIDQEMLKLVKPFVFENALLPVEAFKDQAMRRFVAYAAEVSEKARERGGIDDLDKAVFKSWWRTVMMLYAQINEDAGNRSVN